MKFFYINNRLCTDCGRCSDSCPTGAVYVAGEARYINYDKCTSCGSCIRVCSAGAVTVETVERMAREIENTELYKARIQRLENELTALKQHVRSLEEVLRRVIARLPVAAFVADKEERIVAANAALCELAAEALPGTGERRETLVGSSLKEVFPDEVVRLLKTAAGDGGEPGYAARIGKRELSFSYTSLGQGAWLGILRDLRDPVVLGEEVVQRLRGTIDRQLSVVQKIGFLLGEEVSAVVNDLSSVIRALEAADLPVTDEKEGCDGK